MRQNNQPSVATWFRHLLCHYLMLTKPRGITDQPGVEHQKRRWSVAWWFRSGHLPRLKRQCPPPPPPHLAPTPRFTIQLLVLGDSLSTTQVVVAFTDNYGISVYAPIQLIRRARIYSISTFYYIKFPHSI